MAVACVCCPGQARADGDPASDVLLTQSLFVPFDAGVSGRQQAELTLQLRAAARSGYLLRVALIASPTDLGSVTALWNRPLTYAEYLGEELSLAYRGDVLVVMPDGLGVYRSHGPVAGIRGAVSAIRVPVGPTHLGALALVAIQRLAAASGHPLRAPAAIGSAAPHAAVADSAAWLVFVLGAALIALAWALSLRARPPQLRHRLGHRSSRAA